METETDKINESVRVTCEICLSYPPSKKCPVLTARGCWSSPDLVFCNPDLIYKCSNLGEAKGHCACNTQLIGGGLIAGKRSVGKEKDPTLVYSQEDNTERIQLNGYKLIDHIKNGNLSSFTEMEVAAWGFFGCFWDRSIMEKPASRLVTMTFISEMIKNEQKFQKVRKYFIQLCKEIYTAYGNTEVVAVTVRCIMEYIDGRVYRRIRNRENLPAKHGGLSGCAGLVTGGSWIGIVELVAFEIWPSIPRHLYHKPDLAETAALANAIASWHRDAYDGTKNGLDDYYGMDSLEPYEDLRSQFLESLCVVGGLRAAFLHFIMTQNFIPRYMFWPIIAIFAKKKLRDIEGFIPDHNLLATFLGCSECQPVHCCKTKLPIIFKKCSETENFSIEMILDSIGGEMGEKIKAAYKSIMAVILKVFSKMSEEGAFDGISEFVWCIEKTHEVHVAPLEAQESDGVSAIGVNLATNTLLHLVTREIFSWSSPPPNDIRRSFLKEWHNIK